VDYKTIASAPNDIQTVNLQKSRDNQDELIQECCNACSDNPQCSYFSLAISTGSNIINSYVSIES
jgi:hypothetical protein